MSISRRIFLHVVVKVSEVICSTVLTELCVSGTVQIYSWKLHKNEGNILSALSLLNETVILLSLLESGGVQSEIVVEPKNLPFQVGVINVMKL